MTLKLHNTFITLILVTTGLAYAQDSTPTPQASTNAVITGEGTNGYIDKQRRAPTVSVGVHSDATSTRILVDAYIADPEYKDFPIKFDFYVNREMISSQIRSKELPGAIGITVPATTAKPPFNYSVIATTLHTNRQFVSIVNGAVYSSDLTGTFDCTLTTGVNSEDSVEYVVNSTSIAQNGDNSIQITLDANSTPEGHSVKASYSGSVSGNDVKGNLTITEDGGDTKTVELTGSVEKSSDKISTLNANSSDSNISLSCS